MYRQPSAGQGGQAGAGEEPEQRAVGVDLECDPGNAIGQSGQQCPAEPDGGAVAQPLPIPGAAVALRDVDALIGVVVLLVGDVGDQFLVRPPLDVGEIDRVHERFSFRVTAMRPCVPRVLMLAAHGSEVAVCRTGTVWPRVRRTAGRQ